MTPDDALAKQIEMYRGMTGDQRLKISLDMHTFVCNLSRIGIRQRYPDAMDEEVEQHLRRRIELGRRCESHFSSAMDSRRGEILVTRIRPGV